MASEGLLDVGEAMCSPPSPTKPSRTAGKLKNITIQFFRRPQKFYI